MSQVCHKIKSLSKKLFKKSESIQNREGATLPIETIRTETIGKVN
nr:MAG TPA: hypothetical protein [Bacteriophage sp.]